MIRQPTPLVEAYRWYWAALEGRAPEAHEGDPQCGWYRTRLVKGGPWVAVEIRMVRVIDDETGELTEPERLVCTADGERRDPAKLWTYLEPIPRAEFDALIKRRERIPEMAATKAPLKLSQMAMMRPK